MTIVCARGRFATGTVSIESRTWTSQKVTYNADMTTSRALLVSALTLLMGLARADWWSNGATVTHTLVGYGGNDIAAYSADPLTTVFGLDASYFSATGQPVFLADDYTPPTAPTVVRHLRVRWYQTGNDSPGLARIHVRVYDGNPATAGVLIYSSSDPAMVLTSGVYLSPFTGSDVFRTSASTGIAAGSSQRRLQEATIRLGGGISLVTDRPYFFAWSIESPSGFQLECPSLPRRGNAIQESLSGGLRQWRNALGNPANANSKVDLSFDLFLSTNGAESTVFPISAQVVNGFSLSGGIEDLLVSDDVRMIWIEGATGICQVQFNGTSPVMSLQRLVFEIEASALRSGLSTEILLFNFATGQWAPFGYIAPTEDSNLRAEVILNASQYVGDSRALRAQVRWQPVNDDEPAQDGWFHMIDRCAWRVLPQ